MLTLALLLAQAVYQPDPALLTPRPPIEDLAHALELRAELLGAHAPVATVRPDGTVLLTTPTVRLDPAALLGDGDLAFRVQGEPTGVDHLQVQDAWLEQFPEGDWGVRVQLDPDGTAALRTFTHAQERHYVTLFVDGALVNSRFLASPIDRGRLDIRGNFGQHEAERVLAGLRLPWHARLVSGR